MHTAGHGVRVTSALTSTIISLVGFAFVDDTDLFCAGATSTTTGAALAADFQGALDWWSGGLRATGGALSPTKSFCYLLDFHWSASSWDYVSLLLIRLGQGILFKDMNLLMLRRLWGSTSP